MEESADAGGDDEGEGDDAGGSRVGLLHGFLLHGPVGARWVVGVYQGLPQVQTLASSALVLPQIQVQAVRVRRRIKSRIGFSGLFGGAVWSYSALFHRGGWGSTGRGQTMSR
ncbi:hypothetical protein GCM10010449_83670 [Streptomyces rectiviolaceus]|uniref:Uncharacterized protein n=1 Tax=Streptomyces rectiviolaceus TaxID=332591 RepID=A0ABP6NN88_9ACTN